MGKRRKKKLIEQAAAVTVTQEQEVLSTGESAGQSVLTEPATPSTAESSTLASEPQKRGAGRPKGSKNKIQRPKPEKVHTDKKRSKDKRCTRRNKAKGEPEHIRYGIYADDWKDIPLDDFFMKGRREPLGVKALQTIEKAREIMQPLIDDMMKQLREIDPKYEALRKSYVIAGGNYTFYYVLPYLAKHIREMDPYNKIEIKLMEGVTAEDLVKAKVDMYFTSDPIGTDPQEVHKKRKSFEDAGYLYLRHSFNDATYPMAARQLLYKHPDREAVLKHEDIVFTRIYKTNDINSDVVTGIAGVNVNPHKGNQRLVIDSYMVQQMFAKQSTGIAMDVDSMPKKEKKDMVRLTDEPILRAERRFYIRRGALNLDPHLKALARMIIWMLRHKTRF